MHGHEYVLSAIMLKLLNHAAAIGDHNGPMTKTDELAGKFHCATFYTAGI